MFSKTVPLAAWGFPKLFIRALLPLKKLYQHNTIDMRDMWGTFFLVVLIYFFLFVLIYFWSDFEAMFPDCDKMPIFQNPYGFVKEEEKPDFKQAQILGIQIIAGSSVFVLFLVIIIKFQLIEKCCSKNVINPDFSVYKQEPSDTDPDNMANNKLTRRTFFPVIDHKLLLRTSCAAFTSFCSS